MTDRGGGGSCSRIVRLVLATLLAFWTPLGRAAEPSFDALSHLLHAYAGPVDEKAAEAAPETEVPTESGARLAKIQSDLSLLAEGFETFRHPGHAQHALKNLPDHIIPELRPFFKDRDLTLDTVYRTLAITDYTWALRFPEPNCDPRTRRKIILGSKDGLFTDPTNGEPREDEKQNEYEAYKTRCQETASPGLAICAELLWTLRRDRDCVRMREEWDRKWNGDHKGEIESRKRAIDNVKKRLRRNGCPEVADDE